MSADVIEAVEGGRAVPIQITRQQDTVTGAHTLLISCALWVYNCTGLPIALQQLQQQNAYEPENSYQVCAISVFTHVLAAKLSTWESYAVLRLPSAGRRKLHASM